MLSEKSLIPKNEEEFKTVGSELLLGASRLPDTGVAATRMPENTADHLQTVVGQLQNLASTPMVEVTGSELTGRHSLQANGLMKVSKQQTSKVFSPIFHNVAPGTPSKTFSESSLKKERAIHAWGRMLSQLRAKNKRHLISAAHAPTPTVQEG